MTTALTLTGGAIGVGTAAAVLGWWQLPLLPDANLARVQQLLVMGVAGLAIVVRAAVLIRRRHRGGIDPEEREALIPALVSAVALALGSSVVLVLVVRAFGGRTDDGSWPVVVTVAVAAGVVGWLGCVVGGLVLGAMASPVLFQGNVHWHAGLWILAWAVLAGIGVVVAMFSAADSAWLGRGLLLAVVVAVVLPLAVGAPAVAAQRDGRALDLAVRDVIQGRGDRAVFFYPQTVAVSAAGTVAVIDRLSGGRDALWLVDHDGARMVVSSTTPMTTPDGLPLPGTTSDGSVAGKPTAYTPRAADAGWLRGLQQQLAGPRRASVLNTSAMSFGPDGNLYGITPTGLWRLAAGDTVPTPVRTSWPAGMHPVRIAAGPPPEAPGVRTLMVIVTVDGQDPAKRVLERVNPATGALREVRLRTPDGKDLGVADAWGGQQWYVGLSADAAGHFYTVAGLHLVRFDGGGGSRTVAAVPQWPVALDDASYAGGRLLLTYSGDDQHPPELQLRSVPDAGPAHPDTPGTADPALVTADDLGKAAGCVPVARTTLTVGRPLYQHLSALTPSGEPVVLAPPGNGCLPTLWRLPAGQSGWLPLTRASQLDFAKEFQLGRDSTGPVWGVFSRSGQMEWVASAIGAMPVRRASGRTFELRNPDQADLRVEEPSDASAIAGGKEWWLLATASDPRTPASAGRRTVLRNPSGGVDDWHAAAQLDSLRDLTVTSQGDVVVVRCGQVISFPEDPADTPVPQKWHVLAGPAAVPADGSCPPAQPVAAAPVALAADVVVDPVAVASVPVPQSPATTSPAGTGQQAGTTPDLVYVADVRVPRAASGTLVSRIRVIGQNPAAGQSLIGTLPGGNLADLGLLPVDLDVDASGRVCVATDTATGTGPIVLIANGIRRFVSLPGRQLSSCSWSGDDLVVADAASGDLVTLAVPRTVLDSNGPFVPKQEGQ